MTSHADCLTTTPSIPYIVVPGLDSADDNDSDYRSPTAIDQLRAMASLSLLEVLFQADQFCGDKSIEKSRALTSFQHMDVYASILIVLN